MENANLIKVIVDNYHGNVQKYSKDETNELIRKALIELNGGSTKLNYKAIRDGKCIGLFSLVEEAITKTVIEGLPDDCPLFDFVDSRNLAEGDENLFHVKDGSLFVVSDIANGTQGIRRQRIIGGQDLSIKTVVKSIKVYEELNRVLAGRIDFNELIDKVSESIKKQINADMYNAIVGGFAGLASPYSVTGTFDADKLSELIEHVEAATGENAIILGSRQACRKITGIVGADATSAKEDLYNVGYFGHVGTTPVIGMKNAHKVGGTDFVLGNDLYIVAGSDKFMKFVTEGDTTIVEGDPTNNADLTQEYTVLEQWGVGVAMASQFGVYHLS